MKRKICIILTFLFCGLSSFGKQHQDSLRRNHIAINVSAPILRFANMMHDTDAASISAPLIYIGRQHKKLYTQLGIGGFIKNDNSKNSDFVDKSDFFQAKIFANASILNNRKINSKFQIQYGLHFYGAYSIRQELMDSGFDLTSHYNKTFCAAAGPGVGVTYKFNTRLFLRTEYILYYQYYRIRQGREFSAFPNTPYLETTTQGNSVRLSYPLSIYIGYHL